MACCSCLRIWIQIPRTQRKNSIVIQVLFGAGDRKVTEACCLPACLASGSKESGRSGEQDSQCPLWTLYTCAWVHIPAYTHAHKPHSYWHKINKRTYKQLPWSPTMEYVLLIKRQMIDRIASVVLARVISKHYSKGTCPNRRLWGTQLIYTNSIERLKRSRHQKLLMTGDQGIWGTG